MYYCEICKKQCSGIENFRQHETSEKHKKKVKIFQQSNGSGNASFQTSLFSNQTQANIACELCSKYFPNLSDYQQHTISEEHAIAVLEKAKSGNETALPITASSNICFEGSNQPSGNEMEVENIIHTKLPNPFYLRCEPCDKNFSGPEPYGEHIKSARHIKKCGMNSSQLLAESRNIGSNHINQTPIMSDSLAVHPIMDKTVDSSSKFSALRCDDCDMIFNGPVPYDHHLKGEPHKKRVRRNRLLDLTNLNKPMDMTDSGKVDKKFELPSAFYCDVCNISCSGIDNLKEHNISKKHNKAVAAASIEAKRREILKNLTVSSNNSQEVSSEGKKSDPSTVSTSIFSATNASGSDLGDMVRKALFAEESNLNAVDPSKLNLTVFKTGEIIDFDKKLNNIDKSDLEKIINEDDMEEYYDTNDELITDD